MTLEYWNREDVQSMYDKHLLSAEIRLIRDRIPSNSKVLDAGCGEGEGTVVYAGIHGAVVHAVDFSETRLKKAARRLKGRENVILKQVDFLREYKLDHDYDVVVSQRFLINLMEWRWQKRVILNLMSMLKPGGKLLMLEGSIQGVDALNNFRRTMGLPRIPIKWHNLFLDDMFLLDFMHEWNYTLIEQTGLGAYYLLTRGVRPVLDTELNWDCEFNRLAATKSVDDLMGIDGHFSRLKLWVFGRHG